MLNNMTLQGRFTKDLELKHTSNGVPVCNFTLAWNERYGEKETTLFLNCVAYRGTAEFITKYFKKGDMAVIEGKLTSRSYEKDNEKKYITELIVDKVHFCGSKNESSEPIGDEEFTEVDMSGDLPF